MAKKLVEAFYRREQVKKNQAKPFVLNIFDEGGADGGDDGKGGEGGNGDDNDPRTYTEDEVDRLVQKKKAEWEKAQKNKAAKEKKSSDDRIADLEKELADMRAERTRGELTAAARAQLQADNLNMPDEIVTKLVGEDADTTEETVKAFIKVYQTAVAEGVKEALKGESPKKGGSSKITKEEIMKVENRAERQKLIRENQDLFK